MSTNKNNTNPLWRELRDKITSGEAGSNTHVKYTALCVNNLHKLAEALGDLHTACMMDSDIPEAWWKKHKETVAKAKEALLAIS